LKTGRDGDKPIAKASGCGQGAIGSTAASGAAGAGLAADLGRRGGSGGAGAAAVAYQGAQQIGRWIWTLSADPSTTWMGPASTWADAAVLLLWRRW